MQNAFVNAFTALEPSTGKDSFFVSSRPRPKLPTTGSKVNRIFGNSLPVQPSAAERPTEIAEFVVGKFFNLPSMA